MPPGEVPSPSPSAMPPPSGGNKRPRQSNAAASGAGPSRTKRRKADANNDAESSVGSKSANFGVGMVKGKEDEWSGDPNDLVTKVDFNTLPVEALYKYLEIHDLLPRWDTSPWSEDPCVPPDLLYSTVVPPPTSSQPDPSSDKPKGTSPTPSNKPATAETTPVPAANPTEAPTPVHTNGDGDAAKADVTTGAVEGSTEQTKEEGAAAETAGEDGAEGAGDGTEDVPEPPTTRSKTAPMRKPPTPPPPSPPQQEVKRGVITLSDVEAARGVLAERANAHWVKGLGGGQNKEGETIVNFLYKLKAGPTRLLRVYNPWPAT